MCGRYTLTSPDIEALAHSVQAVLSPVLRESYHPRYNIAPTQKAVIVREMEGRRVLELALWGLPNPWARDKRPGGFINARAETAATLPSFREAFTRGRCGVLADGFYEWSGPKQQRRPLWFHAPGGSLLVFAGLLREEHDAETGEVRPHFAILTTRANEVVAPHHDRMPAIVPRGGLGRWLAEKTAYTAPLDPAPAASLVATPVSPRVGNVRVDDPHCVEPG